MKKFFKVLLWTFVIAIVLFAGLILTKWLANMATNKFDSSTQTEHFNIYYDSVDEKIIPDIVNYLEEETYTKVTTDLNQELDYPVFIKIYPDHESLKKAVQVDQGLLWWLHKCPDWVVGNTNGDTIKIVSPSAEVSGFTYDSILQVAKHEFTHAVCEKINSSGNRKALLLSEGIAVYEAGQNITLENVSANCTVDDLPSSIEEMFSWGVNNEPSKLYDFGGLFVGFIVDNYGYNKFTELYKKDYSNDEFDDDIRNIFDNWILQMETFCFS